MTRTQVRRALLAALATVGWTALPAKWITPSLEAVTIPLHQQSPPPPPPPCVGTPDRQCPGKD